MKKKVSILLILFMFFLPTAVYANENELFISDDEIEIEENKNGSTFIAGNDISLKSRIDGIAFLAGNNVLVKGTSDYTFLAGNKIEFIDSRTKDLFLAGNNISLNRDTVIERDAYIAGNEITISATIGRNIYLAGNKVTLTKANIDGNLNISATEIILDGIELEGTINYNDDAKIIGIDKIEKEKISTYHIEKEKNNTKEDVESSIFTTLGLLVVGFVIVFIKPKLFKRNIEIIKDYKVGDYFRTMFSGLLTLITIPIIALLTMITVIGIPLGLLILVFYVILLLTITLLPAYILGNRISQKLLKETEHSYIELSVGMIIFGILKLIPIIGTIAYILFFFFGLGLVPKYLAKRKK